VTSLFVFLETRTNRLSPSVATLNFLLERNEPVSLIKLAGKCNVGTVYSKAGCHIVLKAFSISKNTTAVDILLLKFSDT